MLSALCSSADRLVARAHIKPSLVRAQSSSKNASDDLDAITEAFDRAPFEEPSSVPSPNLRRVRRVRADDVDVFDASWPSEYAPVCGGGGLRPFRPLPRDEVASARLFLHRRRDPKGAIILVHGYAGGRYAVEERVWPLRGLIDRGFDVALATLPFHGNRSSTSGAGLLFPSNDPHLTNEGVRQSIHDIRSLMRFLKEAHGAKHVGAMGMSLGGYLVSLLATVEPSLAFAIPMIPLADLSDFSRGELTGALPMRRVHRSISPFTRRSLVPADSVLVIGAEADAIAPLSHAQALAVHFNAPLETIVGGHILQIGRAAAFRKALERISDS